MPCLILVISILVLTSSGSVVAADAGKQVVLHGGSQGATACVACHGVNGTGNAAAGFPRLAGLSAGYLQRQLNAYRAGTRQSPVMAPIAKALTKSEIVSTSKYYSRQHPPAPETTPPPSLLAAGKRLALKGDWASTIPACVACHGPGPSTSNRWSLHRPASLRFRTTSSGV